MNDLMKVEVDALAELERSRIASNQHLLRMHVLFMILLGVTVIGAAAAVWVIIRSLQ